MRILAVAAVVLLLAGCVPVVDPVEPTPSPSAIPVFASEEEALAAAEEAYAAYEAAVDLSLTTYSRTGLATVAVGDAYKQAVASSESFESQGRRLVGNSRVRIAGLLHPGGLVELPSNDPMQVYACLDVSATDVVDSSGKSVLGAERQTIFPEIVTFEISDGSRLLVSAVEVWEGDDFCA